MVLIWKYLLLDEVIGGYWRCTRALNCLLASISLCDLVRALVARCYPIDLICENVDNVVAVVKTRMVLILVTYANQQINLRKKKPVALQILDADLNIIKPIGPFVN